jgi:multidrug efflux pump subunit AcrB
MEQLKELFASAKEEGFDLDKAITEVEAYFKDKTQQEINTVVGKIKSETKEKTRAEVLAELEQQKTNVDKKNQSELEKVMERLQQMEEKYNNVTKQNELENRFKQIEKDVTLTAGMRKYLSKLDIQEMTDEEIIKELNETFDMSKSPTPPVPVPPIDGDGTPVDEDEIMKAFKETKRKLK